MTIGNFLADCTQQLQEAGIATARLDCLVLLEDTLQMDRALLLAHSDDELSDEAQHQLARRIAERARHTPLAYIRGKASFYGRDFVVNHHTLVPRPETEAVIELLLALSMPPQPRIADIGTGSGCIGLTAALELPESHVDLYDIDQHALDTARVNAQHLGVDHVGFYISDLLADVRNNYDVILANLPYVPEAFPVNNAAKHEPKKALFSGADGLDHYRVFWSQIAQLAHRPQHIIIESLPNQHHTLALLARKSGYVLEASTGYVQRFSL